MKLSLCLVHYRSETQLREFLESIVRCPPSCEFEVLVWDNSCYEGQERQRLLQLKDDFREYDTVRFFVSDKNLGYGSAHNKLVAEATGEYIALCNCDLKATEGAFDALVGFLEEQPQVGLVAPQLRYEDGTMQDSYRRFPRVSDLIVKRVGMRWLFARRTKEYLMTNKDPKVTETVDWVVGAMMVMRRAEFLALGGFDERYFLFFEDTDLCRKVWKSGKQVVYFAAAYFLHGKQRLSQAKGRNPLAVFFKKTLWVHVGSSVKYFAKWR